MQLLQLANNHQIPAIGYGTWRLKNKPATVDIINDAISAGYRHFDTAFAYGNEETLGQAFGATKVPRSELFITGKLWNDDRSNVRAACTRSIKNLQCEYLDLYLVHWPASPAVHKDWAEVNRKVWAELEKLYQAGLVKAIGVCNFKVNQLEELLKTAKIPPMVNQIEYHIGQRQPDIVEFCNQHNILVEAWSPLGSGKMLKVPELVQLAEKYQVSPAQLSIKWCLDNGVLPLPKSKDPERMRQNLDVFDLKISPADLKILNDMPYVGGSGLDSETITLFG